jgi:hypothetical protein
MESNLRIIKTARSEQEINAAVEEGYWPLVKPVVPSPEIKIKYAVLQDKLTGKISVIHDFRNANYVHDFKPTGLLDAFGEINDISSVADEDSLNDTVINFTYYYPHHFENPFAAYLLPPDIKVGEKVILEDLIEDIVSGSWNQGDTYRLKSCEAIWDGKDFIISHQPTQNRFEIVG